MNEHEKMLSLLNEFKTLNINLDENIFKINGEDLRKCIKLDVTIEPEECTIILTYTNGVTTSRTFPRHHF